MSLTETSIRRPVATAMFYLILLVVGVVGFRFLPVDLLPSIDYPRLTVYVNYPNVGPEEIETIITDPVENALSGVPNVERMTSNSQEGRSFVSLEFGQGTDLAEAANDVRAELDRLRDDLPLEAEAPGIWKFDPNNIPILSIAALSTRDLPTLTRILERDLAKRFEQIPGVGTIDVRGGIGREVAVNLKRDRLMAGGLTAEQVRAALARENARLPGGNVKDGLKDLYVRTQGEYETVDQIRQTVITVVEGRPIRVGDVAEVVDGYQDIDRLAELNGVPVVRLRIQKQSGANTVSVAERVREEVARVNAERNDVRLVVTSDQSTFIQQSISTVQQSALWGALLAVVVLYLFLRNGSTTFIIALSIPISIIATFGLLYFNGLTLNQMTFGGLALGIGLIVDNAIVVLENIVRHRENGDSLVESARVGTREVAGAIVASTLTTSVIFLPLVFVQTVTAGLFQALALVVVFALACSLLVALTLVPMLASNVLTTPTGTTGDSAFQRFFRQMEDRYARLVRAAMRRRLAVFGVTGALLAGAVALWPLIPVELTPPTDNDEIDVEFALAEGTNIAVVTRYLEELEALVRPLLPPDEIIAYASEVRGTDAELEIRLKPAGERTIRSEDLADTLRKATEGLIPGGEVRVQAQSGLWVLRRIFSAGSGTEAIQLQLRGYDLEEARRLAGQIRRRMERVAGVAGVRVGEREGRPEQNLIFNREKIARLGLSVQEVAQAVQTSVGGRQAGQFRDGGEQFPIVVRLRPEDRLATQDLANISVQTPDGATIPVSSVIEQQSGRGPTSVRRINGQRVTYVSAILESGVPLGTAAAGVRAAVAEVPLPEGFSVTFGGEVEEQQRTQRTFGLAIVMALVLIYMVMAGQFERFLDPLIVMAAVPLALVGVVPTLLVTGTTLNIQSLLGIVMLIGIVVNNAIVLVDYINLMRRERGLGLVDAVVEAGRLRLRPILMTTLTTILGLVPLALAFGAGGEFQAPLARVVIGGLTASTLITLVLIPVTYVSVTAFAESLTLPAWLQRLRPTSDATGDAATGGAGERRLAG